MSLIHVKSVFLLVFFWFICIDGMNFINIVLESRRYSGSGYPLLAFRLAFIILILSGLVVGKFA